MLTRILTTAIFAGFITAFLAALLQFLLVQPLLLHSELFESGVMQHFGTSGAGTPAHAELPGFDPLRDGMSVLFTAVIYTGYAFLLVAGIALASEQGHEITPRTGILWGIAGFVAVQLAPAMGLPPELPGAAAADVAARQVWWFGTVAATALGLWLVAFGRSPVIWAVALLCLAVPHIIGAPEPDVFTGPVPPEIAAHFAARALGVGLASWSILGMLAGYFWNKEA
ncbi:CbtA family protein [Neptunicoccus cionae]|uniref:CbtA family protein n=1 Tax=Neptunicoccus cionae TaxID=2035344 RepID=UPI000C775C05|nr:CbtA family protein [Amylibacter cionae]PLS21778.1 cobalt transporter [Amylibacter cionae]